ncbi:unnamed protein product [Mortierella alpina]
MSLSFSLLRSLFSYTQQQQHTHSLSLAALLLQLPSALVNSPACVLIFPQTYLLQSCPFLYNTSSLVVLHWQPILNIHIPRPSTLPHIGSVSLARGLVRCSFFFFFFAPSSSSLLLSFFPSLLLLVLLPPFSFIPWTALIHARLFIQPFLLSHAVRTPSFSLEQQHQQ